ncbi:hypothetical protein [Janthinobacterium sp. 78]|uniref:hypothetical protein n=1 Tax=unclassified Janthinobacterium TaxID=2610881 RepID=UPI0010576D48|nr:hypothetical protein [Janthinobacterium sp. 78]
MSEEKSGPAESGKLNFADVTEDDFKLFLQERVKSHACPSCGTNGWGILSAPNMNFGLIALSKSGAFSIPPPNIPTMGVACNNCGYIRQHALGIIVQWKAAKKVAT